MVLSGSDGTKKVYLNTDGHDLGDLNRHIAILNKKNLETYLNQSFSKDTAEFKKKNEESKQQQIPQPSYEE